MNTRNKPVYCRHCGEQMDIRPYYDPEEKEHRFLLSCWACHSQGTGASIGEAMENTKETAMSSVVRRMKEDGSWIDT